MNSLAVISKIIKEKQTVIAALVIMVFLSAGLLFGALFFVSTDALTFESLESKTFDNQKVFNKIQFIPGWNKDVWMMNQSHQGLQAEAKKWDRIAIVVDKNYKTARFFQLEPGELEWTGREKPMDYKISCFVCHSNGPRAIRPNFKSQVATQGWVSKLKVFAWNLRIKSYGQLAAVATPGNIPLRITMNEANTPLQLPVCTQCHNNNGHFFSRGELTRQNFATIGFMVDNGFMPPMGIQLSKGEKEVLDHFLGR